MRCLKCGYANQMSARFCVNCGSRLGIESAKKIQAENYNNIINNQNQQQQFPQQGQSGNPNGNMQMSNGQKQLYQQQPYQQQQINPNVNMYMNNGQQELPMKWHNFLVYAGFLLSILINLGNAARTIIEMFDEGGEQYIFYGFYPSAKIIDIVFVILNVILSVFLVYIWREMLQKKKNAWKKYLVSIIVVAALNCLAKILVMIIVGTDFGGDIITQYTIDIGMCVIFCSAMVSANNVYYKKRDHLFVN